MLQSANKQHVRWERHLIWILKWCTITDLRKMCNFCYSCFMKCKISPWQPREFLSLASGLVVLTSETLKAGTEIDMGRKSFLRARETPTIPSGLSLTPTRDEDQNLILQCRLGRWFLGAMVVTCWGTGNSFVIKGNASLFNQYCYINTLAMRQIVASQATRTSVHAGQTVTLNVLHS